MLDLGGRFRFFYGKMFFSSFLVQFFFFFFFNVVLFFAPGFVFLVWFPRTNEVHDINLDEQKNGPGRKYDRKNNSQIGLSVR